jgi:hypothetical protein
MIFLPQPPTGWDYRCNYHAQFDYILEVYISHQADRTGKGSVSNETLPTKRTLGYLPDPPVGVRRGLRQDRP